MGLRGAELGWLSAWGCLTGVMQGFKADFGLTLAVG